MRPAHLSLGAEGERLAKIYIERLGWKVVGQNVHVGHKEIDLIARDGRTTVFIEVKTRVGDAFGIPEESVTKKKLKLVQTAVALYVRKHPDITQVRLDVIALQYPANGQGKPKLRHLKAVDGGSPLPFLP